MVFLVGAGRQAVDAGRRGALLVLRSQRRGGDLGRHEAAVDAGIGRQERRQFAHRRIDQQGDAPLRQRADLADRQGNLVGGESDRFGVEIAARQDLAAFRQDERIVGRRDRLDRQHGAGLAQQGEAGAHHLRLAAHRVGILHPRAIDMRGADFAARQQGSERRRNVDLGRVAAQRIDLRIERRVGAQDGVDRKRARHECRPQQPLGVEQAGQRQRGRALGAVDHRQAFLGAQYDRFDPGRLHGRGAGQPFAAIVGPAFSDQDGRQMGERRQIARRADRALRRHRRRHAGRQHPFQGFDDGPLHAGSAAAEAEQLQGHRQADDAFRQIGPDSGIVGEDQIALQLCGLFRRDAGAGQFAEAGVDAVDRRVARSRPRDDRFRARHVRPAGAVEQDRRAFAVQRFQCRQRNRSGR